MAPFDFENLLKQTIGLDTASVGSGAIESAVRLRMHSLGFSQPEDYWEKLCASRDELQELVEAVVVPETWFFRDRNAFSVLERLISEEWLQNYPTGALRLLSVPCCTGEEPYSMIMSLLDAGLTREKLKLDAVDISVRALVWARRGIYGSNSFRGEDLAFRERYFKKVPHGYILSELVRDTVNFHHGNLLSADFCIGSSPYDIIFCRNVLIYFDRETQERVMKLLNRLLAPSGFLFVGPAETFLATRSGFKSIDRSMSFAFRKEGAGVAQSVVATRPQFATVSRSSWKQRARHIVKMRCTAAPTPEPNISELITLESAKNLADVGRLMEAGKLCERLLTEQGPTSEAYYLLGLVRDAIGDQQSADECYRKVLYLEPTHTDAILHLALLSERHGDVDAAQRLRERARRVAKEVKQ